jgi:hypothetical protein
VTLPLVTERLTVNGVDLGSYCYMTTDVSSLLSAPGRRGEDVVVAGRHGRIRTPRKRFDAGEVVLPMWLLGANPDGSVPAGGAEQEFYRRRDELLTLFHGDEVVLAFRRPDGTERETAVEVVDVVDLTRRWAEPMARVSVALQLVDAFWSETTDVSQTITAVSSTTPHNLDVFAGSTAPIADARITFGPSSNPRLAVGEHWVRYNGVIADGRELVLDCRHWRASSGAGAAWTPSITQVYREPGPAWLEFPPSYGPHQVVFTHTGGGTAAVEVAGRRQFLTA